MDDKAAAIAHVGRGVGRGCRTGDPAKGASPQGGGAAPVVGDGEAELREALQKWRKVRGNSPRVDGVDCAPGCLHGMMLQSRVEDMADDLQDIKAELQWIRRLIVAAIVTAGVGTLLRMAGFE